MTSTTRHALGVEREREDARRRPTAGHVVTVSRPAFGVATRSGDRFTRVCAHLRFDDPELFAPRR